jgi:hypothetical protein
MIAIYVVMGVGVVVVYMAKMQQKSMVIQDV